MFFFVSKIMNLPILFGISYQIIPHLFSKGCVHNSGANNDNTDNANISCSPNSDNLQVDATSLLSVEAAAKAANKCSTSNVKQGCHVLIATVLYLITRATAIFPLFFKILPFIFRSLF